MAVKEILVTLTSKGQITIPAEVQRRLGLNPHDKMAFAIDLETDEVRLYPAAFPLRAVFGSVRPATETEDFEHISRRVREQRAADETRKLDQE